MADFILRTDVENAFLAYIESPLGEELRNKCVELFDKELLISASIEFASISRDRNVNALMNITCYEGDYEQDFTTFVVGITFETLREYKDDFLKTDITNNVWREPIREKTVLFITMIAENFKEMLDTNGIKGHKRFKIEEILSMENRLSLEETIQQAIEIKISLKKCLINQ